MKTLLAPPLPFGQKWSSTSWSLHLLTSSLSFSLSYSGRKLEISCMSVSLYIAWLCLEYAISLKNIKNPKRVQMKGRPCWRLKLSSLIIRVSPWFEEIIMAYIQETKVFMEPLDLQYSFLNKLIEIIKINFKYDWTMSQNQLKDILRF